MLVDTSDSTVLCADSPLKLTCCCALIFSTLCAKFTAVELLIFCSLLMFLLRSDDLLFCWLLSKSLLVFVLFSSWLLFLCACICRRDFVVLIACLSCVKSIV